MRRHPREAFRIVFHTVIGGSVMYRKHYLTFLSLAALFLAGTITTFAQTGPVRGEVKLQKADGTTVPVADAVVDVYRLDIDKGGRPSGKTNKKGEFSFIGFPLGQRFALAVSGPGIGPRVQGDIKAGMENIVITVTEGDGKKLTEEEVRSVLTSTASAPTGEMTEAQKKELAEYEKKKAEVEAKNKAIQAGDAVASKSNTEGVAALNAKNYDLAIQKFGEGVAAVPDFIGSTPINLNGLLVAHRAKGYGIYRDGAAATDLTVRKAKYEEANKEYNAALGAFQKALDVIKNAEASTDPAEQKRRDAMKRDLYANAAEVHRLKAAGGVDTSMGKEAEAVISEYVAMETDPAKKLAAQVALGDVLRETGNFDKAVTAYKAVLEADPNNMDATAQVGLTLVALGTSVDPPNKEQLQEGLNYMQKFADAAPDTHRYKNDVKQMVEYLKTDQKLTPQKAPAKRKN